MKRSTRLLIATAIVLLAAVAAVGVWAGPIRSGTVPPPPDGIGDCGAGPMNFGTGTVKVFGTDCKVTVTRGARFGAPPEGWHYLSSEVLEVKIVDGAVSQVEVCVPFNPDWKGKEAGKSINFFYWNAARSAWVAVLSVIKNNETPPLVCGTSASAGFYAIFGK